MFLDVLKLYSEQDCLTRSERLLHDLGAATQIGSVPSELTFGPQHLQEQLISWPEAPTRRVQMNQLRGKIGQNHLNF